MHPKIVQGLTLYYSLFSAPCRTVLLTLKSLGIELPPGGMKQINIHEKGEHLDLWFEKINYEKKVPTIVDNGLVLWESHVISKYLVQKYATEEKSSLYPADISHQARVDWLLYFDHGSLSRNIHNYFNPQMTYNEPPNPVLGAEVERSLQLLEKVLSKGSMYALGGVGGPDHLTIADFSFLSSLSNLESMDYSYERYEPIRKYAEFLKDQLIFYGECCQEGINVVKDWARRNLKYLPRYLHQPGIPYDEDDLYERRI